MITFQHHLSILLTCLASLALVSATPQSTSDDKIVFQEKFEGQLGDGWEWINENGAHWCVREGALEIRVVPGLAATVKNALVRAAPDRSAGSYAIEVDVTNLSEPTQQYEQAGLTLYQNGKPVFKFVKELVDGQLMMIPGRKEMESPMVRLRLIVTADSYTAQYQKDGKGDFQTAASGKLRPPGKEQISIQCYNGPADKEHWIRFDNFRIIKLAD